jgi:preprotein translocase subunit SecB
MQHKLHNEVSELNNNIETKFIAIALVEETFKRERVLPLENESENKIDFNINSMKIENQPSRHILEITTKLELFNKQSNSNFYYHECKFIGVFDVILNDCNDELYNSIVTHNLPAMMFPYIREHITNISSKAGISPIILPPMNIVSLLNEHNNKDDSNGQNN